MNQIMSQQSFWYLRNLSSKFDQNGFCGLGIIAHTAGRPEMPLLLSSCRYFLIIGYTAIYYPRKKDFGKLTKITDKSVMIRYNFCSNSSRINKDKGMHGMLVMMTGLFTCNKNVCVVVNVNYVCRSSNQREASISSNYVFAVTACCTKNIRGCLGVQTLY